MQINEPQFPRQSESIALHQHSFGSLEAKIASAALRNFHVPARTEKSKCAWFRTVRNMHASASKPRTDCRGLTVFCRTTSEVEARPMPSVDAKNVSVITTRISLLALSRAELSPRSDDLKGVDNAVASVLQSKRNNWADVVVSKKTEVQGGLGVGKWLSVPEYEVLK
jgi:hypothetical protein